METATVVERDFNQLTLLFNMVLSDMKNTTPLWEDFILKTTKLHTQLKSTVVASTAFLDSFQKIADTATSAKGGTKDIGSALTRLCLRQRSVESHLKTFTSSIMDCLVLPLTERLEEWKKVNAQLDKEHSKEYKKYRQELKKKPSETNLTGQGLILYKDGKESIYQSQQSMATLKLKKLRLNSISSNNGQEPIYASMDLNDKLVHFEQLEKSAVRRAMIEERSRYCILVSYLKNVIEEELLITQETSHLQEIMESLNKLTVDPYTLPASSELVIADLKLGGSIGSNSNGQYSTLKDSSAIYASTQQLQQMKQQQQQNQSQAIYGHLMNHPHGQSIHVPNHLQQVAPQIPNSQPTAQPISNQISQLNHLNNSQTPPSSPSSFSSRKSSCCSISSFNSSSSGSTHSPSSLHHLATHHHHHHLAGHNGNPSRFNSQGGLPVRIPSIASHDSGFISNADTLSLCQVPSLSEHPHHHHNPITSGTLNSRNWINNQADPADQNNHLNRPHTISAAFEKTNNSRPALSSETFEPIYDSKILLHNKPNTEIYKANNQTLTKRKNSLTLSDGIKNNGHTTVIKVESKLSNYDHQQKFIEELDNVIAGNQPKASPTKPTAKTASPPEPPVRKVSLQAPQTADPNSHNISQRLSAPPLDKQLEANDDNNTVCSESASIGSITPTNSTNTDTNLYRLSNVPIEDKTNYAISQRQMPDDHSATLTRQNSKNAKLSTSLKSVFAESNTLSHFNGNQLSLTNLNQPSSGPTKPAPPPPIRRTSSISNPNAITLETLRTAGVSTYEEIKSLTLANLNRFKKNTTNYATYEDVSRLGMSMIQQQHINAQNPPSSHYATFSPNQAANYNLSHQDIYSAAQYGLNNFNTYSGPRSHYRISSCTNLINTNLQAHDKYQQQQQIYSATLPLDVGDKNEDKEKTINQLRSEYQQAKHLFENLECNQQPQGSPSQSDFQAYLTSHQTNSLETDSGCGSNSGSTGGGSQTSSSSIAGQLSGHISRMTSVRRDFMETLNAKLSSPLMKSSPRMKRRSLSIGHDSSDFDYDLNESISSAKTISTNSDGKKSDGHFSLQQSFMRLVQTNYAKITRSPELTRKFLNSNSGNSQSTNPLNQPAGSSLMSSSFNSSLANSLFNTNSSQATTSLGPEMAKECASIAIKKKQNAYPTSCGSYEVIGPVGEPNGQAHTTTIQVDSADRPANAAKNDDPQKSACQEIYQPAQNLQIKTGITQNSPQNLANQRRCSQPSMGTKVMSRQVQPPQQLTFGQPCGMQESYQMQNADERANFLNKLDAKLSPAKEKPAKSKNEFENQIASRVETWLNKSPIKSSPEEELNCRESLLDQIRKADKSKLKKVEMLNDRSAPII